MNPMKGQLAGLMKQAQQMQENMQKMQAELGSIEVEGQAGAGMVKVTMNCQNGVKRVAIDDSLLKEDKDMLEDLITAAGGALTLLRAHKYDRVDLPQEYNPALIVPQIPQEFSRWERESRSWRETVALFDQSHHMTDLYVQCLQWEDKVIDGKIFNAGYENHTVAQLAETVRQTVADTLGGSEIKVVTTPSNDHRSYHVSSAKLERETGFRATHSIADAVRDLVTAFDAGQVPNAMTSNAYYNIKTMQLAQVV